MYFLQPSAPSFALPEAEMSSLSEVKRRRKQEQEKGGGAEECEECKGESAGCLFK